MALPLWSCTAPAPCTCAGDPGYGGVQLPSSALYQGDPQSTDSRQPLLAQDQFKTKNKTKTTPELLPRKNPTWHPSNKSITGKPMLF